MALLIDYHLSGRLSEILRHQSALLEHIVSDQRYYSDYYRVTFYGNFPVAIRDKRFIVRVYIHFYWNKTHNLISTGDMSGKSSAHSANGCLINTLVLNY
jgi:hypothetical protein